MASSQIITNRHVGPTQKYWKQELATDIDHFGWKRDFPKGQRDGKSIMKDIAFVHADQTYEKPFCFKSNQYNYGAAKNWKTFIKYYSGRVERMKKMPKHQWHTFKMFYYELFRHYVDTDGQSSAQQPHIISYGDYDMGRKKYGLDVKYPLRFPPELLKTCVDSVTDWYVLYFNETYGKVDGCDEIKITNDDIIILTASSGDKISFHFLLRPQQRDIVFPDMKQQKIFMTKLKERIAAPTNETEEKLSKHIVFFDNGKRDDYVDIAPYGKNQAFRMPFSVKKGNAKEPERYLTPYLRGERTDIPLEEYLVSYQRDNPLVLPSIYNEENKITPNKNTSVRRRRRKAVVLGSVSPVSDENDRDDGEELSTEAIDYVKAVMAKKQPDATLDKIDYTLGKRETGDIFLIFSRNNQANVACVNGVKHKSSNNCNVVLNVKTRELKYRCFSGHHSGLKHECFNNPLGIGFVPAGIELPECDIIHTKPDDIIKWNSSNQ